MDVQNILVIGAGTMGHGIAQVAAQSGYKAVLFDVDAKVLAAGLAKVKSNLEKGVEKGKEKGSERKAETVRERRSW